MTASATRERASWTLDSSGLRHSHQHLHMVRVVGGSECCSRLFNVVLRGYYIVEIKCLLAKQLDGMQNVLTDIHQVAHQGDLAILNEIQIDHCRPGRDTDDHD